MWRCSAIRNAPPQRISIKNSRVSMLKNSAEKEFDSANPLISKACGRYDINGIAEEETKLAALDDIIAHFQEVTEA